MRIVQRSMSAAEIVRLCAKIVLGRMRQPLPASHEDASLSQEHEQLYMHLARNWKTYLKRSMVD